MHGIGNDYVYVNGFEEAVDDPATLARAISDRHTGVGGDGLILVLPPDRGVDADARMRMFNADGSESEMCGNGIRCVCKLAHDHGITKARPMRIQTGNGVLSLDYTLDAAGKVDTVTVDMGEPILEPSRIPIDESRLTAFTQPNTYTLAIEEKGDHEVNAFLTGTMVSMGNPDVGAIDLEDLGPKLERHPAFPRRINVHFVQVDGRDEVTMRTWERGTGVTLACGTGACAVAVSGVLTERTEREVHAHLPGGDLTLRWDETTNHVFMTGPATEVFRGDYPT